MRTATSFRHPQAFLAWALVGALAMFGALSILTVGIFVLALAAVLGALTLRRAGLTAATLGLVAGLGIPLAYVGWLNREGPGTVCHPIPHGTSCTEAWSPWPWWCAAALCLVAGTTLFGVLSRKPGS